MIFDMTKRRSGGGIDYLAELLNDTLTSYTISGSDVKPHTFRGASNLATVHFTGSNVDVETYAFNQSGLTALAIPSAASIGTYAFAGCTALNVADINLASSIPANAFNGATSLNVLVLRKSSGVTALSNVNAFTNTPFKNGGTGGTIYIPKALYDHLGDNSNLDYKKATNWSTVDGYGTITWAKIEGSIYETQYADGTPIPTT